MVRVLHYSDIENVYDHPERAARLAGCLRERGGDDALVVGTGDNTAPGVLALIERGRQALDFFAAAGTDIETFGNHDFDFGPTATRELVKDSACTWVSANVRDAAGAPFGREEGVVPWTIEQVGGINVGLFGVTDSATDSLNPMAADLTFDDPYAAATRACGELRDAGADLVVACSHLGAGDDDLARATDVDLVLGGHVHSERAEVVDGVLCTRPGVNGEFVYELDLELEGSPGGEGRPQVTVTKHASQDFPPDGGLQATLRDRAQTAGLDDVVAHVAPETGPIDRTEPTIHGGESRIGNFVADAYRWAGDADVGLQNSGGIRAGDPLEGAVTVADLISVIPFEEPVVTVSVTGDRLREIFRQMSASVVDFGEPGWWHGHLSGASVVWDTEQDRLLEARVDDDPIDPERRYTVATAEYLLHSDHEFPAIDSSHRVDEHGVQHEVLAAYARENGIDPSIESRITQVSDTEPPEQGYRGE